MLQIVGGVSTVTPTQRSEYLVFFVAILCGTVLLSAVQGVICGVVTNGDPDEISWRQVRMRASRLPPRDSPC